MIVAECGLSAQVSPRLGLAEEIERQERDDNRRGPEAEPVAAAVRPADAVLRQVLDGWFREFGPMVGRVVARSVRREDLHLVDDLTQDVWVEVWQYLLRGNTVARPAGLLAVMARSRVCGHYRLARTRREVSTDFQDYERAVDRLASWIGTAA
ncbi:RNA polymerase sigma factor [Streptomyces nitrosporeus]|uniref:RNA polymerase sigma factor n=2 Tax=Streptomyces nitrosporeus TaxID=28894 RepID=UPI00167EDF2D|nr:sigma-70 family RNA polymerase sigma factor [Streptomyces nitrosporeus]